LQDQFGKADRGDELEGFTYRDMAQAMGNRGLRVDDRFDANALLQRMRNMQDQPKAMEGTQFNVQRMQGRGKNRGYQNVGNFQNLSQQRATAQRRMQAQAPANVNPFGGLRGAGPQRPAPAPKPTSTPKKPAMPKFVGPGNIDSIMGK
jgi:TolA-binding protein